MTEVNKKRSTIIIDENFKLDAQKIAKRKVLIL